ncbi:MAG: radical SAM family heme chaperone HemW [Bacteroidales bacterium]|nr:radical SAM family heme chaperone HemW [Bacteroidales bacterium]
MLGLYIHIPFCASRCIYCDFYSTTGRNRSLFINALLKEIERTASNPALAELVRKPIRTIYFGGGTPSQLSPSEIHAILDCLGQHFDLRDIEELTLEMNPDDISENYLSALPSCINRVSLGIQSLVDSELKLLNRRHDADGAKKAVLLLKNHGFNNISLDLMYGLPGQTLESFEQSIEEALALQPQHLSAYNLSIEEGTPLARMKEKDGIRTPQGLIELPDEETCNAMNALLRRKLKEAGFVQYEISNYALPGFESKHNSSYWNGTPYIGFGPGANSYDGNNRRWWNEPNLDAYISGMHEQGEELLSEEDRFNEQIMLPLRTIHGINIQQLEQDFPLLYKRHFVQESKLLISEGYLSFYTEHGKIYFRLSEKALHLADYVIRRLIV